MRGGGNLDLEGLWLRVYVSFQEETNASPSYVAKMEFAHHTRPVSPSIMSSANLILKLGMYTNPPLGISFSGGGLRRDHEAELVGKDPDENTWSSRTTIRM